LYSKPKISVLIVNYKVPKLLLGCLSSIELSETSNDIEVFVIDNDSGDQSQELVTQRYPAVTWIQNERNLGFAQAVNIGVKSCSGHFILLLNPDCVLDRCAVEVFTTFLSQHQDVGIAGGKLLNTDGSFQPQCRRNLPKPMASFFRLFGLHKLFSNHPLARKFENPVGNLDESHEVEAVSGAFLCINRHIFEKVGYFDENYFLYGEDLDFCHRVSLGGYKICYLPDAVATHVRGASREKRPVRTLWYTHHAMFRYYRKFLASDCNFILNCIIYIMIWMRWFGLVIVTGTRTVLRNNC